MIFRNSLPQCRNKGKIHYQNSQIEANVPNTIAKGTILKFIPYEKRKCYFRRSRKLTEDKETGRQVRKC